MCSDGVNNTARVRFSTPALGWHFWPCCALSGSSSCSPRGFAWLGGILFSSRHQFAFLLCFLCRFVPCVTLLLTDPSVLHFDSVYLSREGASLLRGSDPLSNAVSFCPLQGEAPRPGPPPCPAQLPAGPAGPGRGGPASGAASTPAALTPTAATNKAPALALGPRLRPRVHVWVFGAGGHQPRALL